MDWEKLKKPPEWALKTITGGRLKGMADIKPQWRIKVMNEVFGPCGDGWRYEIIDTKIADASEGQKFVFVDLLLYWFNHESNEWSKAIPGNGGSMLIAKESGGLHCNDEAIKMAITDALGSAMKMIGVAEEVYLGNWTGSKYVDRESSEQTKKAPAPKPAKPAPVAKPTKKATLNELMTLGAMKGMLKDDVEKLCIWYRKGDLITLEELIELKDNFDNAYAHWLEEQAKDDIPQRDRPVRRRMAKRL